MKTKLIITAGAVIGTTTADDPNGYELVDAPEGFDGDPKAQWLDCMRMDIARLVTCDAVYLLPGWEKSRGAKVEHGLAVGLGFQIINPEG